MKPQSLDGAFPRVTSFPAVVENEKKHVTGDVRKRMLDCLFFFFPAVSSDFTADEKLEMENIKMYKKALLDDIQVKAVTAGGRESSGRGDDAGEKRSVFLFSSRS